MTDVSRCVSTYRVRFGDDIEANESLGRADIKGCQVGKYFVEN